MGTAIVYIIFFGLAGLAAGLAMVINNIFTNALIAKYRKRANSAERRCKIAEEELLREQQRAEAVMEILQAPVFDLVRRDAIKNDHPAG